MGEVLEGHQGGRVVLAQRAAQGVGVPGACPDQVLVGAGENFDRFRIGTAAGDWAEVVPVGAYQIGQQLGVEAIGFGARDVVTVAVVCRSPPVAKCPKFLWPRDQSWYVELDTNLTHVGRQSNWSPVC